MLEVFCYSSLSFSFNARRSSRPDASYFLMVFFSWVGGARCEIPIVSVSLDC